jgi:SAM-dependent methyltransferase
MTCCCSSICDATERQFSKKRAAADLQQYRDKGPGATARMLLEGLAKTGGVQGFLLDIGSGVGAIAFELLQQGMAGALGVDLSSAYVAAASDEASRLGRSDSVRFVHADFVDVATNLSVADVVTLDRVICCYPDHDRLLDQALKHARRYIALSYPRDLWYVRFWVSVENFARQLRRISFRAFVHSATAVEGTIRQNGFSLQSRSCTRTWCADVYRRI